MNKKESAASLLIDNVPVINQSATVEEIQQLLHQQAKNLETISYIYLLDQQKKLAGVVSIKDIFSSTPKTFLRSLVSKDVISVRPHTDRERVAMLALKHNLKAVPVVDKNNLFLGVVTNQTISRILHEEGIENMLRLGGVLPHQTYDDIFHLSVITSLKHRLPWLLIGLFGGIAAALIVDSFELVLKKNLLLAAFIPLIVYMADAVGTQMEAFIIRDLAINPKLKLLKYFSRQAFIVLLTGGLISVILYGISLILYHDPAVSLVLATALFCAIISSLITGLLIPCLFDRLKLDPANASGPVATVIQDVLSIIIYFTIAQMILFSV